MAARLRGGLCLVVAACWSSASAGDAATDLAPKLRELNTNVIVLGTVRQPPLATMIPQDVAARLRGANRSDIAAWQKVQTRGDWERFRASRIEALRRSLGTFPSIPRDLQAQVTGTFDGDGFQIRKLVFESRPGLLVTANLYLPQHPAKSMPAILICHSHHEPKDTGARQDMALTWARAGCVVLVPDHLGHGERRQHPFGVAIPHDYHFRYDAGIQLHLVGESLMGWMAWDLMRGVDLLLARTDVDPKRILLISEPAGGGDVAAVTGALDERITAVMVQNFGGPEPETPYPLPVDAAESFDYAGSGSWESTRNLRLSARDGFLPWTIVASIAPRKLIYFHEFYWDQEQDPVWGRLRKVWRWHERDDSLVGIAGHGFVVGSAPENTHWLPENREKLFPVLKRWFVIPDPGREYSGRRPAEDLHCLTPEIVAQRRLRPLHALAAELGAERAAVARAKRDALPSARRRTELQSEWTRLLGRVDPAKPIVKRVVADQESLDGVSIERVHMGSDPGIVVPALLFVPRTRAPERRPVVVGFAQEGKHEFLRHRAETVASLLRAGIAVCLVDVRGTGETAPDDGRGRRSTVTALTSSEWMLGDSLLAGRLRDLRTVLQHLRERPGLDLERFALWGESFAPTNPPGTELHVPHTAERRPRQSEPLGGLLALLGALFEKNASAVYAQGGLADFGSVLADPFCYLPHDVVVPGVLTSGDLCDVAAALAPRPLWLSGLVDGHNQLNSLGSVKEKYRSAAVAFAAADAAVHLRFSQEPPSIEDVVRYFQSALSHAD